MHEWGRISPPAYTNGAGNRGRMQTPFKGPNLAEQILNRKLKIHNMKCGVCALRVMVLVSSYTICFEWAIPAVDYSGRSNPVAWSTSIMDGGEISPMRKTVLSDPGDQHQSNFFRVSALETSISRVWKARCARRCRQQLGSKQFHKGF
jgi:hypothetical protein